VRIDAFAHGLPAAFKDAIRKEKGLEFPPYVLDRWDSLTCLSDTSRRFKLMDEFGIDRQVICTPSPPLDDVAPNAATAGKLARIANDTMAELVEVNRDRLTGIATISLLDPDEAIGEVERAVTQLGLKGVLMFANPARAPLDSNQFIGLFDKIDELGVPVWLHPCRSADFPDYVEEDRSKYLAFYCFGWPYDTTIAMTRFVFGGIFDRHPDLKVVAHHAGAMVPFFAKRIEHLYRPDWAERHGFDTIKYAPVLDHFRKFYIDCATYGSASSMMNAYDLFGADHILFGTDMPFDSEDGLAFTREGVRTVENMPIGSTEKRLIWSENALRICGIGA
jgi:predicted TIM-barrel fold metal-dependent hydrolase